MVTDLDAFVALRGAPLVTDEDVDLAIFDRLLITGSAPDGPVELTLRAVHGAVRGAAPTARRELSLRGGSLEELQRLLSIEAARYVPPSDYVGSDRIDLVLEAPRAPGSCFGYVSSPHDGVQKYISLEWRK